MSTTTTENIINDVAGVAGAAASAAFPAITSIVAAVAAGLPVAEALWNDGQQEWANLTTTAVITPAQIAADDAALAAADSALPTT